MHSILGEAGGRGGAVVKLHADNILKAHVSRHQRSEEEDQYRSPCCGRQLKTTLKADVKREY
jgi:hypothetical protein